MKNTRQKQILELIASKDVETQNQLIEELRLLGIRCTQATVSRDIRELGLRKELAPSGAYRYAAPGPEGEDHMAKLRTIFRECVTSYRCAQNIVVLRTLPGLAPAACSAVDKMNIQDLAGSLAGDDTAFLAMTDCESAKRLCEEIREYF